MMRKKQKKKNNARIWGEEEEVEEEGEDDCSRKASYSLGRLYNISSRPHKNSRPTSDMRRKRVRFTEPDMRSSCEPDTSSLTVKESHAPKFEDPKTTEFTFYKKLREDAGRSFHSHELHRDGSQHKKCEASNHFGGPTNMNKPNSNCRPLSPIVLVEVKSSHSSGIPRTPGPDSKRGEIFSVKRQNLLDLAIEASSLDINNDACSKGFDLVSTLLGRLVSESNTSARTCESNKSTRTKLIAPKPRSMDMEYRRKSELCDSCDIHIQELTDTPSTSFSSPFHVHNMNNGALEWSSSRAGLLSHWDNTNSDSLLTWPHPDKLGYLQYQESRTQSRSSSSQKKTSRICVSGLDDDDLSFKTYRRYVTLDHMPVQSDNRRTYYCEPNSFHKFDQVYGLDKLTNGDTCSIENLESLISSRSQVLTFEEQWLSLKCELDDPDFLVRDICSGPIPTLLLEDTPLQEETNKAREPNYLPMTIYRPPSQLYLDLPENSPLSKSRYTSHIFRDDIHLLQHEGMWDYNTMAAEEHLWDDIHLLQYEGMLEI